MKDFNPNIKCPKCGHEEVKVYHMEKVRFSSDYLREYKEDGDPVLKEHLRRECLRCHFSWPENIINDKNDKKEKLDNCDHVLFADKDDRRMK